MKNKKISMKKVLNKILSRIVISALLLIVQIAAIFIVVYYFAAYNTAIQIALRTLSVIMTLYIIMRDENSSYKIIWIIAINILPFFGGLMYLVAGNKRPSRKMRRQLEKSIRAENDFTRQDTKTIESMERRSAATAKYIAEKGGYPVHTNTSAEYFPSGEELLPVLLEKLEKAEHYIYIEYFIISLGEVWQSILSILEKKVSEGVDVRVIYDDVGCIGLLPPKYPKYLESIGIKTINFNRFVPFLSVVMNHRDHRKILVIDGHTAFTGGINLSDEYFNIKHRFGYWKDTAVMIEGDAVMNMTVMFAQMWNAFSADRIVCDFCTPHRYHDAPFEGSGYVQPFSDSPLDDEQVGENIYIDILNQAQDYVYIFTPYLIIDDQMRVALTLAAKRGVDVRLVTPGIPDKKPVFRITRSHYLSLIEAGVKIYEYSPGFIHAKSYVCDDRIAVVGSINMDFRSLYLHFECGIFMCSEAPDKPMPAITALKEDCEQVFAVSRRIEKDESRRFGKTLLDAVLRLFGPLI